MCKKLGSCAIIHSNSWDLVVSWTLHWHVPVLQNSQRGLNFLRKLCKKRENFNKKELLVRTDWRNFGVFLFSRYHFHNWNVSRKCGFRNITTYLSLNYFFTLQFDTVTRVKASNTHQNAGFHPARPSSSESTESMSGKCKSVSWGVCTENKICDTILKQCRTNVQVPLSFNCNEIISGEPKTDF